MKQNGDADLTEIVLIGIVIGIFIGMILANIYVVYG
jgi:uncharacterized membrane-anchored protein YhcB (DUF1043 family)